MYTQGWFAERSVLKSYSVSSGRSVTFSAAASSSASPASSAFSSAGAAFTSLPAGFAQLWVKLPARLLCVAGLAAVGADTFRFQPRDLGGRDLDLRRPRQVELTRVMLQRRRVRLGADGCKSTPVPLTVPSLACAAAAAGSYA